jgi:citronellol/citronellal dehydrogenase
MRLKGRVAIVTGASRGIGRVLAVALAREGAAVTVAAKTDAPSDKLPGTIHDAVEEIEKAGGRAIAVKCNVREESEIDRMVERTVKEFGKVDILINNAGAIFLSDVVDTPPGRFDLVMDVNARASFLCSRAVLPGMIQRRWGHILMMSPPMNFAKTSGKAAYMLSKLGMTLIAQGLADEVKAHNIGVNALWPVTAIESQATIHFQMGEPSQWRKPEIMSDAVLAILTREPSKLTGKALYDEDVLREMGVTDFSKYACVPGTNPPPLSKLFAAGE